MGERRWTDGIGEADVGETFTNFFDEDFADVVFFIVLFVRVTLIGRSITSHGRNIDHPSSEFDECSPGHTINTEWKLGIPFDGKFQVCYIVETEIDELLVLFLAQVMDESLPFSTL